MQLIGYAWLLMAWGFIGYAAVIWIKLLLRGDR